MQAAISSTGAVSQVGFTKAFGVSRTSISTMTESLLGAGLVSHCIDPGQRQRNMLALKVKAQAFMQLGTE